MPAARARAAAEALPFLVAADKVRLRICTMYECCNVNRWKPWHDRLKADGVTMIVSGQRKADMRTLFHADGTSASGLEMWLPIEDWSDDDVFEYLKSVGAPLMRFYEHKAQGPECATCPASWDEGRAAYLKEHHPELAARYARHLQALAAEISPVAGAFISELRELGQT
jgi:3'-phosphoadenosine 5'-phosphosulfate sulfotransferase (PAPS reductase)/FAD synthetase